MLVMLINVELMLFAMLDSTLLLALVHQIILEIQRKHVIQVSYQSVFASNLNIIKSNI